MANVPQTVPLNVSFRRGLVNENLTSWYDLVSKVVVVNLTNGRDVFIWNHNKKGLFVEPVRLLVPARAYQSWYNIFLS